VTPPRADAAKLNVQPRQRRDVYERLAELSEGRSVKDLLGDLEMPESELRETLRKLDQAGLVHRTKGLWWAVPLEPSEDAPSGHEPPG
jgi:DNA-binding transcriptional ArsR family regulator